MQGETQSNINSSGATREIQMREAICEAMSEEMRLDSSIVLMGEEVAAYNGAYKCSRGMLDEFGPKRVIDTPIAECGFTGVGIGAAMVGLRPIVEFMTFNFSLVAIDQILNTAAKAHYMSAGQLTVPAVFRGAGGVTLQLAAQHTNAFESFYAYTPGLKVVVGSTPYDTKGLLKSAIRDDDPVVFFEAEMTYSVRGNVPSGEYTIPLGQADIKREGSDLTLVCWGKLCYLAEQIADTLAEDGVSVEIVDLRTLRPLDTTTLFNSVAKTHRVAIVQEQHSVASYGAYISHLIASEILDELDAPIKLIATHESPTPYSKGLEHYIIVTKERAVTQIMQILQ